MRNILLLTVILLVSCFHGKQKNISSEKRYIKDSLEYLINYYPNGKIKNSCTYRNGLKDGWECIFSENGKCVSQVDYRNGKQNGWETKYYNNGRIEDEQLYIDGKIFGSGLSYYRNGAPHIYNCYDFSGNNRRVKIYDSLENVIKDDGLILGQATVYAANSTFDINNDVLIDVVVSTPPNERIKVWMYEESEPNTKNEYQFLGDNVVTYRKRFDKPGNYNLITIARSLDTVTNKIYSDSLITPFKVIK